MGSINFFYDWDWAAADRELKHVIELDPETAEPYACTLHYLDSAGRPDDAVAEVRRIAAQHPTSITLNAEIGCSSYYAHDMTKRSPNCRTRSRWIPVFGTHTTI
jgi:hypothetical protein